MIKHVPLCDLLAAALAATVPCQQARAPRMSVGVQVGAGYLPLPDWREFWEALQRPSSGVWDPHVGSITGRFVPAGNARCQAVRR